MVDRGEARRHAGWQPQTAPCESSLRRRLVGVVAFFLLAANSLGTAPARAQPPSDSLDERLSSLLAKLPKGTQVGLAVADADSGQTVFAHEADTPLKPASVQKLLVTAAALERFGPAFRYETRVYLLGDELWVVGAGDPGLGDERLATRHNRDSNSAFDEWAGALKTRGVTALSRIVLDDTIFDQELCHPDWPDGQADRWYQAPVGGLNLNDNCLDVGITVHGKKIELRLQPDLPPDLVRNGLKLGKKNGAVVKRRPNSDIFELSGTVSGSAALDPVSVRQPTVLFGQALRRALERREIAVPTAVVRQRLTDADLSGAALLATHTTTLPDVLWRCNTFSQNLFAECLVKSLAAYEPDGRRSGTPGSWEAGLDILRTTLGKLGLDLSDATLRDGSGLSHANRVTAGQFTQALVLMRRHRHADVFLGSLAEAGEPGSMKNRYADPALRGRLRGKTGTIQGVHTLAGYLTRSDGKVLAFALLINGPADYGLPVQVCKALLAGNGS